MSSRTLRSALTLLALLCALGPRSLAAQAGSAFPVPPGEADDLVDRVVAVVGDSVVLMSQVMEELQVVAQQPGVTIPSDPDEFRQLFGNVLETLVNVQLILHEAAQDSTLLPDEAAVDMQVQSTVGEVQSRFPSIEAFEQALAQSGITANQYRENLRSRIRREQVQRLFLQRRLPEVPAVAVTEDEMREIFNAQQGQLQELPELLTLEQVVIPATASDSTWALAKNLADSLKVVADSGADFAALARENTQEPGGADRDGDLGWFRRGVMVREFEDVAFNLRDGQVSEPVRTPFGWHVIKVERSRPGEVRARHILIIPEVTPDDLNRTRLVGSEVANRFRQGETVDSLAAEFGEEDSPLPLTFQASRAELSQLPPGYAQALSLSSEGQVIGPFQTNLERQPYFAVVRVAEIREAGAATFDDVREQIRASLQQQKRIERLWESLRSRTHVEIRF